MHPIARAGCIFLLLRQWDAEEGMLPGDPEELRALAALSLKDWKKYSGEFLALFQAIEPGKLKNTDVYDQWIAKKRLCESRKKR